MNLPLEQSKHRGKGHTDVIKLDGLSPKAAQKAEVRHGHRGSLRAEPSPLLSKQGEESRTEPAKKSLSLLKSRQSSKKQPDGMHADLKPQKKSALQRSQGQAKRRPGLFGAAMNDLK